jgi:hypothetical protein
MTHKILPQKDAADCAEILLSFPLRLPCKDFSFPAKSAVWTARFLFRSKKLLRKQCFAFSRKKAAFSVIYLKSG